jgi:hypothetical protein
MAEQLALHLSIDQAGAYLVVVHGLGHQRIALRPVIAALGDEPDAPRDRGGPSAGSRRA